MKIALTLPLAAVSLLAAAYASADVTKTYAPNNCIGIDKATEDAFVASPFNRDANWLNNPTSSSITIVCPIIKQTSGPGITTGDHIKSISIPMGFGAGRSGSCKLNIWRSDVLRDGSRGNRVYEGATVTRSTNGNLLLQPPATAAVAYWNNAGTGSAATPNWRYADVECTLPIGGFINGYTVVEAGNPQPTRTYPFSACTNDGANSLGEWRYSQVMPGIELNGGRVYFAGGGPGESHIFKCLIPNNVAVEVSVIPSFPGDPANPQVLGCNIDSLPSAGVTWPSISQGGTTSFQLLPRGTQPSILTPSSGTHYLRCGQRVDGNGDGGLVAFRTIPPLVRNPTGAVWTATASHSNGADVAAQAIDTNTGTRWTSGRAQQDTAASVYFQVDMKSSKTIRQIVMNTTNNDYPRNFRIFVSATDSGWSTAVPVYTAFPSSTNSVSARFQPATGRYVRVVLTPTPGVTNWWSIHDFNVYQ
jgi:hypothetical protein